MTEIPWLCNLASPSFQVSSLHTGIKPISILWGTTVSNRRGFGVTTIGGNDCLHKLACDRCWKTDDSSHHLPSILWKCLPLSKLFLAAPSQMILYNKSSGTLRLQSYYKSFWGVHQYNFLTSNPEVEVFQSGTKLWTKWLTDDCCRLLFVPQTYSQNVTLCYKTVQYEQNCEPPLALSTHPNTNLSCTVIQWQMQQQLQ